MSFYPLCPDFPNSYRLYALLPKLSRHHLPALNKNHLDLYTSAVSHCMHTDSVSSLQRCHSFIILPEESFLSSSQPPPWSPFAQLCLTLCSPMDCSWSPLPDLYSCPHDLNTWTQTSSSHSLLPFLSPPSSS